MVVEPVPILGAPSPLMRTLAGALGMKTVGKLVASYDKGELEAAAGRSLEETLEIEVMSILGKARDKAGSAAGWHYSFMGSTAPQIMEPAAKEVSKLLLGDSVNLVILIPV